MGQVNEPRESERDRKITIMPQDRWNQTSLFAALVRKGHSDRSLWWVAVRQQLSIFAPSVSNRVQMKSHSACYFSLLLVCGGCKFSLRKGWEHFTNRNQEGLSHRPDWHGGACYSRDSLSHLADVNDQTALAAFPEQGGGIISQ